ncbi:cystathionine gamma-synthase, partial [Staphylococcus aureus]
MEQINRSVIEIFKMLKGQPTVQQVFHPRIESHLNQDVHMAQADGQPGVIAFEGKNTERAKQLIKATSYYT